MSLLSSKFFTQGGCRGAALPLVPSMAMAAAGEDRWGQGCSSPRHLWVGDAAAASQPREALAAGAGAVAPGSAFLLRRKPVLADVARHWITKVVTMAG